MKAHSRFQSLKVLLVSEPGKDGVFRHVEDLSHFLIERGICLHFAYSSIRGCKSLDRLVETVALHGGSTLDLRVGSEPAPQDVVAFARLLAMCRKVRPDVIHAHSSKAGLLARATAIAGIKARYFYTPHAYFKMSSPPGLKRQTVQIIESILGRVGTTLNVSLSEAQYALRELRLPPSRQRILPNGVDISRFRPAADAADKQAARARFGLPANALILGTIARYSEQKDPLTLYRSLIEALRLKPAMHFAHLGEGNLSDAVNALLKDAPPAITARIHRLAPCEDTPEFLRAVDGFVLPSRYEGMALAVLEAAATGLPLILSRCPGNVDFDGLGMNCLRWTPPGDPAVLGARILEWAAEPLDARHSCNHREVILEKFSQTDCFSGVLKLYSPSVPEHQEPEMHTAISEH